MIERFSDSLNEAASRCRELTKAEEENKPEIFVKLVHALKVAAGSSHQLSMAQMNPNWLFLRDALEKFMEFAQENVFKDSESGIWLAVSDTLLSLSDKGQKMAAAKAVSRQEVLEQLDVRQEAINKDVK